MKLQMINMQRQLDFKDQEVARHKMELTNQEQEIGRLKLRHSKDIDEMEKDIQAKYDELKQVYQSGQALKNKESHSLLAQVEETDSKSSSEGRLHDLEMKLRIASEQAETNKRIVNETKAAKESLYKQLEVLESKAKRKKQKIRDLRAAISEQSIEFERVKLKNEQLMSKVRDFSCQIATNTSFDTRSKERSLMAPALRAQPRVEAIELNLSNKRFSHKDEKSPATQRNEFPTENKGYECTNERCSHVHQCSPCVRNYTS